MKKEYIIPEITDTEIILLSALCESDPNEVGGEGDNTGTGLAPGRLYI